MIRRLQKKFILLAVLSVFMVLLVLMGAINIINYRRMVADADGTLEILAEYRGYFPMPERNGGADTEKRGSGFRSGSRSVTPELPYQSRWFTAFFNSDGKLYHINLENIASLDGPGAITLAQEIFESGKQKAQRRELKQQIRWINARQRLRGKSGQCTAEGPGSRDHTVGKQILPPAV